MTRSLHSIEQLSHSELRDLLSQTLQFSEQDPKSVPKSWAGRTLSLLFYENSTRTRLSFESAIRNLGGTPQSLSITHSSVQKGESLQDTALNLVALGAQGFILRHPCAGASVQLARAIVNSKIPVINAGDGMHAHPTQALLDAATLIESFQNTRSLSLEGKKILILGDIRHSRVARSNLELLPRLGAEVLLCGPGSLLPSEEELSHFKGVRRCEFPDPYLEQMDAVMTLRLQLERQEKGLIPSLKEYRHFWGLTRERASRLSLHSKILHPGPVNPGVEIDAEVMSDPRAKALDQVRMGIAARMAVLNWAIGGES